MLRQSRLCNFLRRLHVNKGLRRNVAVGQNISGCLSIRYLKPKIQHRYQKNPQIDPFFKQFH
jgi:hypothetical protein